VIFPVRLFASTEAAGRDRLTQEQIDALGFTDELPNGRRHKHGRLGGYVTATGKTRRPRTSYRRYSETLPRVGESAVRDARCSIPEG